MTRPEDTVREGFLGRLRGEACKVCSGLGGRHSVNCRVPDALAALDDLVAERDRLLEQATQDRATILLREAERDRLRDALHETARKFTLMEAERDRLAAALDSAIGLLDEYVLLPDEVMNPLRAAHGARRGAA